MAGEITEYFVMGEGIVEQEMPKLLSVLVHLKTPNTFSGQLDFCGLFEQKAAKKQAYRSQKVTSGVLLGVEHPSDLH